MKEGFFRPLTPKTGVFSDDITATLYPFSTSLETSPDTCLAIPPIPTLVGETSTTSYPAVNSANKPTHASSLNVCSDLEKFGEGVLGKVRTRKIKTLAKEIKEGYADRVSTSFEENKKLVREVLEGRFSKKLANRIAGYLVALKKLELKAQRASEPQAAEPSTPES